MPDLCAVVKLDEHGHVCAVSRGIPRGPWIECPPSVAADPFGHRLCSVHGWVGKAQEERDEFDERHALPEPIVDRELAVLVRRAERGALSNGERDKLLALLVKRVLS